MTDTQKVTSFAGLKINNTLDMNVINPVTLQPSGWIVTLASTSHPKAKAFQDQKRAENLAKAARVEAQVFNRRKVKPEARTLEEDKAETAAWLVSRTLDWTPVDLGSGEMTFSDENATKVYLDPNFDWFTRQVVELLENENAFIEGSAKK